MFRVLIFGLLAGCVFLLGACATREAKGPPQVDLFVSAANYAETPRDQLLRAIDATMKIRPAGRQLATARRPQYFIACKGETYDTDVPGDEVLRLLLPALAQKHFYYAGDPVRGTVGDRQVDLILRISYGIRTWRIPTVRAEKIEWTEGLVERADPGKSIGGTMVWHHRAGGDNSWDRAMGSAGIYETTRWYHILAIDAFEVQALRKLGAKAPRAWSTFVAIPSLQSNDLRDRLADLTRGAAPYLGETTDGIQHFPDLRAEVTLGELIVVGEAGATPASPPANAGPPERK